MRKWVVLNRQYIGARDCETKLLVSKLERLVVGPWGEASKDLDLFVRDLGESRVFATAMSPFENDYLI